MKKLISLMLALMLVFSLATVAMASTDDPYKGKLDKATSFTKEYVVTNGTAPKETFDFNVSYKSFKNNEGETATAATQPTVTLGDAVFNSALSSTGTANVSVEISNYETVALGAYTYEITEVAPTTKTAGTTYNSTPVYLVVTILRDETSNNHYVAAIHYETAAGAKTGTITNSYNAGQLSVTKQIEGNMADMDKKFEFTVVFTPATGTAFDTSVQIANDAATTNRTYTSNKNADGTYTIKFNLGDNETATFTNIPVGTTYTITEDADGYTRTHTTAADGSIAGGDRDEDVWTNTLNKDVDTGITLDSLPFVLILAVCAGAVVLFVIKRRNSVEF